MELSLLSVNVYKDNPQSLLQDVGFLRQNLIEKETSFNDIQLTWDGDINLDDREEDVKVFSSLDSFVQMVFIFLKTQIGTLPGDSTFGTELENIIGATNQINIKTLAFRLKKGLESLEGIDFVDDVSISIARKEQHRILLIEVSVKPRDFDFNLSLLFSLK